MSLDATVFSCIVITCPFTKLGLKAKLTSIIVIKKTAIVSVLFIHYHLQPILIINI